MKLKKLIGMLAVVILAIPGIATATNGYFAHGYGMKAKGMGGAATAMASDAMGGANNPASMVWVGDRLDIGIDWFRPIRSAKREGSIGSANDFSQQSDSNNFFIPEFGYNKMLNNDLSLGVTVSGNGMNTDYAGGTNTPAACTGGVNPSTAPVLNGLCGSGKLGVSIEQVVIAPTLAYKIDSNNAIGVAPLLAYQRFYANGLDAFAPYSLYPRNLTNQGYDSATGLGMRIGWQGRVSDSVTLGAAYSSKVHMGRFDKYKGLFAEQGGFDIPENYSLGIAWKVVPVVTLTLDYERINYGGVKSIADSSLTVCAAPNPPSGPATGSGCLGGSNGMGAGWSNVDVWKLGSEWQYSRELTLRAGFNHGDQPIQSNNVTSYILASAVVQDHLTLGGTYAFSANSELTVAYMHAFEKSVSGPTNPLFPVGGTEAIKMVQDSLGVSYGVKF